jgi:hypothetical protein
VIWVSGVVAAEGGGDVVPPVNSQRLMHRLGSVPPAEAEARYYSQLVTGQPAGLLNPDPTFIKLVRTIG